MRQAGRGWFCLSHDSDSVTELSQQYRLGRSGVHVLTHVHVLARSTSSTVVRSRDPTVKTHDLETHLVPPRLKSLYGFLHTKNVLK